MTSIRIAKDLTLPLEVVTQAIGILAKRRVGKSYLARRMVEQLFGAGQQVVIVDPKGDWWGARSSADGKSDGLPIVIFGGERGDVPLEVNAGSLLAKVIVEGQVSALLDLSLLRKHEVATFMAIFLEDLYRLKAHEQHRTPLMLVVDEADAIAPQKPQLNEARMLGALQDVVRRGGQRGLGCIVVTQRSAVLSKDVLTQVEMLVTLRTIAPQDLAAIKAWIDVHGTLEGQKILMASLPSLPIGDAWFWSPGWPTDQGLFQRSHVMPITTFDSGATPKPGQKRKEPKSLAAVDLGAIREQMAATLERAKADNPRALRARIAELEKEARQGKPADVRVERVEVPEPYVDLGLINGLRDTVGKHLRAFGKRTERACKVATEALAELDALAETLKQTSEQVERDFNDGRERAMSRFVSDTTKRPGGKMAPRLEPRTVTAARAALPAASGVSPLSPIERALLTAYVQHGRLSLVQAAIIAGYSTNSGSTAAAAGKLRASGLIDGGNAGAVATAAGRAEVSDAPELPTGPALAEIWFGKLSPIEGALLKQVIGAYPEPVSLHDAATTAGYSTNSGSTAAAAGKLRTLQLVHGGNAGMTADRRLV